MKIKPEEYKYYAMHKPKGYVCALKDYRDTTIMELFHEKVKGIHIVGRLDKDTTGLVLLTNDGTYTHKVTHPKKHVAKKYLVTLESPIKDNYKDVIEKGMLIDHGKTQLLPGVFEKIDTNKCYLTIKEGKFHQVKKMFVALDNFVTELHREEFDIYSLEELGIAEGEYKEIK